MRELDGAASRGIFALPNEIFLSILSLFPTRDLISIAPTSQYFHSLVLRVLHQRLQVAASLAGHTLYLECHHPSARLTASMFFCTYLGTAGLDELSADIKHETQWVGQLEKAGSLYSRFRPQRNEPDVRQVKHPAGDIPGSRTYRAPSASGSPLLRLPDDQVVTETVTVDAHDLFCQLETSAYLGKREQRRGFLSMLQNVSEGTIRVWRDWLARQCESKKWTDGDTVIVHHEPPSPTTGKGKARSDSLTGYVDPKDDPSILWINTRDDSVGIKFRVKERKLRRANPILYTSDVEVAVSYEVEFEGKQCIYVELHATELTRRAEVFVRTTHLLLRLEEAQKQLDNHSGKAIVFGSYAGSEGVEIGGQPRRLPGL